MKLKATHKLGMLLVLLSCPAVGAMAQQFPDPCYFAGWSAGIGVGGSTFLTNIDHDVVAPSLTSHTSGLIYKNGVMGNIFLGYAGVWDCLYLGGEIGVNFLGSRRTVIHSNTQTINFLTATTRLATTPITRTATITTSIENYVRIRRRAVEPMLDLKPGIFLAPWGLLYARIGVSYNEFNIKSSARYRVNGSNTSNFGDTAEETSSAVVRHRDKNEAGFRLGLGLEYLITQNLGIGGDYVYTWYENINSHRRIDDANTVNCDVVQGCTVTSDNELREHAETKISDQQVMLQLIYHFNC